MHVYTHYDYKILKNILDKNDLDKGLKKAKGTSVKEIVTKTGLSDKKVRNTIKLLMEDNLIFNGISNGKTRTFCVSEEGLEEIQSIHISKNKEE